MLNLTAGIAYGHVLEKLTECGKMYKYGILPHNEAQPLMYEVLEVNVSTPSFESNRGLYLYPKLGSLSSEVEIYMRLSCQEWDLVQMNSVMGTQHIKLCFFMFLIQLSTVS